MVNNQHYHLSSALTLLDGCILVFSCDEHFTNWHCPASWVAWKSAINFLWWWVGEWANVLLPS